MELALLFRPFVEPTELILSVLFDADSLPPETFSTPFNDLPALIGGLKSVFLSIGGHRGTPLNSRDFLSKPVALVT